MLVVFAHTQDAQATALVERWAPMNAKLLTVHDLSRPGWQHHFGGSGTEYAVVDGSRVETAAIRGVVTRLPCIQESDLSHITPQDRPYVAAEMTAFVKSWLSRLSCPVLNRPTASSLMGPSSNPERWMILAARCGLALATRPQALEAPRPLPVATPVTVVGRRWFGSVDDSLGARCVDLATRADVTLLTVHFDGQGADARFLSAELCIDLTEPQILDALLEQLGGRESS